MNETNSFAENRSHAWLADIVAKSRLIQQLLFSFIFGIFSTTAFGQTGLLPEVQADLLRNKIFAAAQANDLKTALSAINDYKALKIDLPPPLLLVETKAAHKEGDTLRAFHALQSYLRVADRGSTQYRDAP